MLVIAKLQNHQHEHQTTAVHGLILVETFFGTLQWHKIAPLNDFSIDAKGSGVGVDEIIF